MNKQDEKGFTALMFAADKGYLRNVENLLKAGPDVNIQNKAGFTALMLALQHNNDQIIDNLWQADPEVSLGVNVLYKDGTTPLMKAIQKQHFGLFNAMVKAGADGNKQDEMGCTALMLAAMNQTQKMTKEGSWSYLLQPAEKSYELQCQCMDILTKAGADINQRNKFFTALTLAAEYSNFRCVCTLAELGADVNVLHPLNGGTVLFQALFSENLTCTLQLLQHGIHVNVYANSGNNALQHYIRSLDELLQLDIKTCMLLYIAGEKYKEINTVETGDFNLKLIWRDIIQRHLIHVSPVNNSILQNFSAD